MRYSYLRNRVRTSSGLIEMLDRAQFQRMFGVTYLHTMQVSFTNQQGLRRAQMHMLCGHTTLLITTHKEVHALVRALATGALEQNFPQDKIHIRSNTIGSSRHTN